MSTVDKAAYANAVLDFFAAIGAKVSDATFPINLEEDRVTWTAGSGTDVVEVVE